MAIEKVTNLILQTIDASTERGGWQASASFANDQEAADYGRRGELYSLLEGGGVWEPNNKLTLRGSILPNVLTFDRRQSSTDVTLSTSDIFLANAGLQGIYFTNTTPSTNPHQIPFLNLGKIVEHIVEQHTNISIETAGGWVDTSMIDTLHSTSVDVYTVKQSNSMWQTIAAIAANEFYVRYFTKEDKLIYARHPQFEPIPLPTPVVEITSAMLVNQPEITFRDDVQTDQVQMYALTDTGSILQASYPASIGTEGRRQKFTNIRCNSQGRLNLLAERAYKFLNRKFNVRLTLAGPWIGYLELYDRLEITYAGTTRNGVDINWNKKKFWVNRMYGTREGNFGVLTEIELEEENL